MNYWLDCFTGTTWDEFRRAGSLITGFNERFKKHVNKINPGDIFICYLTGVKLWVGALEAVSFSEDKSKIWKDSDFPVRFSVRPIVVLDPENGIPMEDFEGKVAFYQTPKDAGKYKGFVRMSPNLFRRTSDGEYILNLLKKAEINPVFRDLDPKKLARKPFFRAEQKRGKSTVTKLVSVPVTEEADEPKIIEKTQDEESQELSTRHTEIQYELLSLGSEMGCDVWVARNDRNKKYDGKTLGTIPRMISELPTQFNEATNRTIELIDVLWLKGNSIIAAFEVECTTSIYSGLLRMSDLMALQPNLAIKLYLVAPEQRRNKVEQEILRPTFSLRESPLASICGFLPFNKLVEKIKGIRSLGLTSYIKVDFLEETAEYFGNLDGEDS